MIEASRILRDITSPTFKERNHSDKLRIFNDFAERFGWRPSDYLGPEYGLARRSNGHLIVEHGLEHAAVITFMVEPEKLFELPVAEVKVLLGVSYNNLVDWHLAVDPESVCIYFNRTDPIKSQHKTIAPPDFAALSAESFQDEIENPPFGNLPTLDTVLVQTIDYWKRFLHEEIRCTKKNEAISALFNAIIFVRIVEDHYQLTCGNSLPTLLERWRMTPPKNRNLGTVLIESLRSYKAGRGASSLLTLDKLTPFESLDSSTIENLIHDFYKVKKTPYTYDFALMSRHALSRIYEKYVALLKQEKTEEGSQKTLFPIDLPEADRNKAAGAIYTPQFIPRFFCRFIEDQIPSREFRELNISDPACGSGIFLRTFLERKIGRDDLTTADIQNSFKEILGLDVDENACQASRLSLASLHLMRTNTLPSVKALKVFHEEAIQYYQSHKSVHEAFGAVVGNPPFVRLELQEPALQRRIRGFLSGKVRGRLDLYLAILRLSMNMVRPAGFIAFVLPHSFLIGKAPNAIRRELRKKFWLRCVVDLSAIRVFEDFSAYVVLLIAQKKSSDTEMAPACRVVLCQDFVGRALQDCLDNKTIRTPYYSVFDVDQEYFGEDPWVLLAPEEVKLERKLQGMPKLDEFLTVREGLITGDDKVFILSADKIPSQESELYAPFLPDRQIQRYSVPDSPEKYVYYPYHQGKRIPENELRKAKSTWSYLKKNRANLRKSVSRTWPYILRPRAQELLRPKIISPHLVLSPRFALDIEGKYTVSHAPFLIPYAKDFDLELLKFFTAVLNSSIVHWYLGIHGYRFSRGYVMLDPVYLRKIPVPDPSRISPSYFNQILKLVDRRMETGNITLEDEIDELVLDAYGLNMAERKLLGIEVI
jgi:tRNA1(Val) A37 N6-methylase TrmN6